MLSSVISMLFSFKIFFICSSMFSILLISMLFLLENLECLDVYKSSKVTGLSFLTMFKAVSLSIFWILSIFSLTLYI